MPSPPQGSPPLATNVSLVSFKVQALTLLATGQTVLVPSATGRRFIPQWVDIVPIAYAGTLSVSPRIRIGNNGSFDNVLPLFTCSGPVVQQLFAVPPPSSVTSVDIGSSSIVIDVQTAGTVATTLTADFHIIGILV